MSLYQSLLGLFAMLFVSLLRVRLPMSYVFDYCTLHYVGIFQDLKIYLCSQSASVSVRLRRNPKPIL